MRDDRRRMLLTAALGVAGMPLLSPLALADDKKDKPDEDVGASEDLMREHGVLNRVLLIFEEALRRLGGKDAALEMFHRPAMLVRKFVEDYHEKLEENFIFPAFEKKKKLVALTTVLRKQHKGGRDLTDVVLRNAEPSRFKKDDARKELADAVHAFIRMYRPHEAREDTVLFPALHTVLTAKEIKDLGAKFEKEEDRLFGDEGFEKTVDQVATIEKQLGIYELDQFTPKASGK